VSGVSLIVGGHYVVAVLVGVLTDVAVVLVDSVEQVSVQRIVHQEFETAGDGVADGLLVGLQYVGEHLHPWRAALRTRNTQVQSAQTGSQVVCVEFAHAVNGAVVKTAEVVA